MSLENSSKEAMYALDATNPLSLYDCLIPELEAYRPLKLPQFNFKQMIISNNEAKLKLAETQLKLVSYQNRSFLIVTSVMILCSAIINTRA